MTLMSDDEALADYLKRSVTGTWHASCSNRMGRADDPMAVTDNQAEYTALRGFAWSTPRSCRACLAPIPTSQH